MFLRLDKNQSGYIDQEEYVTGFMQGVKKLDADRSGRLTFKEFPFKEFFAAYDADHNGVLSFAEAVAGYQIQFAVCDENSDGVLTPDEM